MKLSLSESVRTSTSSSYTITRFSRSLTVNSAKTTTSSLTVISTLPASLTSERLFIVSTLRPSCLGRFLSAVSILLVSTRASSSKTCLTRSARSTARL